MIRFVQATRNVVCASIKASGQIVHSILPSEPSLPITLRNSTVSFDASWHRRGHFSNQGFAAVIESESGKVLDHQLYDRVGFSGSSWTEERKASSPDVYAEFWDSHKALCNANFSGSSQSMESSAAVEVWKRSIETHGLIYGTYIGDGDSSSYKNLVKSNPYDGVASVRKEECLGLVQKRIKKRLSKTTKSSKGLSEVKADRIAHLYALVIVQHKGESAQDFHEALHILLRHTEEKHDTCPGGNSSCCYYQKLLAKHLEDNPFPLQSPERHSSQVQSSSGRKMCLKYSHLLSSGVHHSWTNTELHESLHNMLWHNVPKSKRVCQKSLVASTTLAVISFNEGSLSYSGLMKELGIQPSYNSIIYLARRDRIRNQSRTCRIFETHKHRRRQIIAHTKLAESSRKRRDKASYTSGKFGSEVNSSGDESDTLCAKCQQRESPNPSRSKYQPWVCCHMWQNWYHYSCEGIRTKRQLPQHYFCSQCKCRINCKCH